LDVFEIPHHPLMDSGLSSRGPGFESLIEHCSDAPFRGANETRRADSSRRVAARERSERDRLGEFESLIEHSFDVMSRSYGSGEPK